MRILGIDPGLALVGYGVIEVRDGRLRPVQFGKLETSKELSVPSRLEKIYRGMKEILQEYKPDEAAVEKLYFNTNTTTAIAVAEARGVILLASEEDHIPVYEYTPLQVKQTVVGYGQAEKRQVQMMIRVLLGLKEDPKPDDVADALGIAITHAHFSRWKRKEGNGDFV
ncbi:crossover junction endodeoxyribonuclease RuvC [Thermicanus aegyptius]|uniref:crossover junction endodeoxyribonuclease RuvC n=1 Tax=Thermicanus aegyptius TaxID=94009 RepID=UPI000403A8EA|nr:crossover junction endodeoxyribonuclease RuvC [Thermicanus aegyptius]